MVTYCQFVSGMGSRHNSSRPRKDRDAHIPRPRCWLHQPRRDRDVKISRRYRDETFV